MTKDVWFITGASTGLGKSLVQFLLTQKCKVVATARNPEVIRKYTQQYTNHDDLMILPVDVTDKQQIATAIETVVKTWNQIDVLLNNAGYAYFSSVEFADDNKAKSMFDVNFWGVKNMLDAVLPIMRKQKSGHIMNVSSLGGLRAFAGFGYYHATKFALEGLTESLSQEVAPLGIDVTLLEPGDFKTDFADRSSVVNTSISSVYDATAGNNIKGLQKLSGHQPGNPSLFAKVVFDTHQIEDKPFRLLLGSDAYERATEKYKDLLNKFEHNREITLATDFHKKGK
ncbi:short-chain dehydrogenase/reductase [Leuconostoc litchii]|uniref:SDR family NAD(P)-dependent oxidoreductase n=1 Tax=Leuconostoc litchii TaxID=1981069 RepID=A0A6P2CN44_9LACO|nr:SDR family NAD(P)-dependent oxidoreductase [Leuconostoc litchii]TYC47004.1 SDR family NAD(P)-dependent oxidoreductase [Leuconostoc litchii]GMA68920.1 short-chain dehydrogenase/reductase [Leuconostoc litchii]